MWHRVSFKAEFNRFEFRVLFLLEPLCISRYKMEKVLLFGNYHCLAKSETPSLLVKNKRPKGWRMGFWTVIWHSTGPISETQIIRNAKYRKCKLSKEDVTIQGTGQHPAPLFWDPVNLNYFQLYAFELYSPCILNVHRWKYEVTYN